MRAMFQQYPEVILVDTTFNTNDLRYKLMDFMVMDCYGIGQHVMVRSLTMPSVVLEGHPCRKLNQKDTDGIMYHG